jgi:hypothetical protein
VPEEKAATSQSVKYPGCKQTVFHAKNSGINQMAPKKQRKKIYLGWRLHGRIVARFAMYWALYHVIVLQALCGRDFLIYETAVLNGKQQVSFEEFVSSLVSQHLWVVLLAVAVFPVMLWEIVRLTHRFVGPLKQLGSEFRRLAEGGDIRAIKFRQGDFADEVEEAFNQYVASQLAARESESVSAACAGENGRPSVPRWPVAERHEPSYSMNGGELASLLQNSQSRKLTEDVKALASNRGG